MPQETEPLVQRGDLANDEIQTPGGNIVIVLFGGAQVDRPGAERPRFPQSHVEDTSARVRGLLSALRPRLLVGAAASGADLIFLTEALALGLTPHVVLPFPVEKFQETSVESRGPDWVLRYKRVIDQVRAGRGILEILGEAEDEDVYLRTNGRLLDYASQLGGADEEIVAVLLRPGGGDGRSVTDDLGARAEMAGLLVLDLDCLRRPASLPSAFVAMPYGKKIDPQTGIEIDCDLAFNKVYVPVLEDLDYRWLRSDRETDTGIVHIAMIEAIANSDVVIADLATLNANVLYEVGLRHALADKTTVLTVPDFGTPPKARGIFDVDFIRRIPYSRTVEGLSDRHAVESIRALRRVLTESAESRPADSPVFVWFDTTRAGLRARQGITRSAQHEIQLRQKVANATVQGGRAGLLAMIGEIDDPLVSLRTRQALRLEIAIALREQGAYTEAVNLLAGAQVPADPLRVLWLQQLALALRRQGEQKKDGDPNEDWDTAQRLLDQLLGESQPSGETYGIAAGLAKRRLGRFLSTGQRQLALAQLSRMIDLYRKGFEAEPWDYYVGINVVAGLRLRGQRFGGPDAARDLTEARETIPMVRMMLRRLPPQGRGFWAEITAAELVLHAYELDDPAGAGPSAAAAQAYADALASTHPPDYEKSARDQLDIFRAAGDPAHVIDAILEMFATA
jgi:tetratricopeptide (TPR) repeat protein